jgi:hypothetical protein
MSLVKHEIVTSAGKNANTGARLRQRSLASPLRGTDSADAPITRFFASVAVRALAFRSRRLRAIPRDLSMVLCRLRGPRTARFWLDGVAFRPHAGLLSTFVVNTRLRPIRPLGHPDFSTGSPRVFHWVTQDFPWVTQALPLQQRVANDFGLGWWLSAYCSVLCCQRPLHFMPLGSCMLFTISSPRLQARFIVFGFS